MIAMGITLRHSPIPKHLPAVLYIGIGGGLFLSSLFYYGILVSDLQASKPQDL
ncbi:MAG: hypothetical protein KJ638_03670 [Chloroflexi bacterium]|nr:hypothetical protein [Chloroflexota bacterium]